MKKQQIILAALFAQMGIPKETQDEMFITLFPADENAEPSLDTDIVLQAAQDYSKPFLKDHFERELQPAMKGKYLNDAIGKLVGASGGLLTRKEVEGKTIEEVAKMYADKAKQTGGASADDQATMIDALNAQLAQKDNDWGTKLEAVQKEYEGKEKQRQIHQKTIDIISGKTISVKPNVAVDPILSRLERMGFEPRIDPATDKIKVYKKGTDDLAKKPGGTAFYDFDELLTDGIKEYGWEQKSQGGAGAPEGGNSGGGGSQSPAGGVPPVMPNFGGTQKAGQPIQRSAMGEAMERAIANSGDQ